MSEQEALIEKQMKKNYIDYAMSVITSRALPDVRDGLKPVHRRILYGMNKLGLVSNKSPKKSARIVGEILGKYHPHGDTAVYDTLVRMAQTFSLRYPLINGQGNWGSVDGDRAAAMRYCVTGDSLIVTEKGLERINEISNQEDIMLKILSKDKKIHNASKWFDCGKHKTIKITTNKGYTLTGTENHPILTLTKNEFNQPIFEWKLLEELKQNDLVVIDRKEDCFWPKEQIDLKQYLPKVKSKKTNIRILPEKLNENLSFILGLMIAEGTVTKNKIEFCNSDRELIRKFEKIWKETFPDSRLHKFKRKPSSYGKKEYSVLECHCRYTIEFLRNIGLKISKSSNKRIPFLIFKSPKGIITSFLKSYFEGDGSISHSNKMIELNCCSKSEELIEELQIIFLRLGIDSFKRFDKYKDIHKLYLRGKRNILRFYKYVNFISKRKKQKLELVLMNYKKETSLTDYVPFISDFIRNLNNSPFIKKNNFDRYSNMEKNHKQISSILLQKTKKDYSGIFEYFLTYNYLFEPVTKIEHTGENKVYSIKVDGNCHTFISNGFISHNTEAKLSKISEQLLVDIDKDTVDLIPNFDNNEKEPSVLPAKLPNLLINGSSGIAVGMATNIPPHNITEVISAINLLLDNPETTTEQLTEIVKAPDFPTGAYILNTAGIKDAYKTGRGKLILRAKTNLEKKRIIVTEIPYQINKSVLIQDIANLVKDKRVEGIRDIRDESNKKGIRIVLELKESANPEVIQNQLFKLTNLQTSFGVIMLALVDGAPRVLNLKQVLHCYILHRKEVVTRRTQFELKKAEQRAHILEGLKIALINIDPVIGTIKSSETPEQARNILIKKYKITEIQSNAILDMKLSRLTSLETKKIEEEHNILTKLIIDLKEILNSEQKVTDIIKTELQELKETYKDERRTEIIEAREQIETEELIKEKDVVITVSHQGYIKQIPLETYKTQKRGGQGIQAAKTKEEDFIENLFITSNHNSLLFFTNKGKVHWLKAHQVPEAGRYSKGKAIINLLNLKKEERIQTILPIKEFNSNYVFFATKHGLVKKTSLEQYSKPRSGGIQAISLKENDELVNVLLTSGENEIFIATKNGNAVKFNENDVREMGRTALGVRGIKLKQDDQVIGLEPAQNTILTVTEKGYGKRTHIDNYRTIKRGGIGVRNIRVTEKNSTVTAIKSVSNEDDIMLITKQGILIRLKAEQISSIGRDTQGVRIIKLKEDDKLITVAKVVTNGGN